MEDEFEDLSLLDSPHSSEDMICVETGAAVNLVPRSYQLELFDHAKMHNSIMVLGTGSGKTFIAILLLKHLGDQIRGPLSGGARRTILVANTVQLVRQQADAIRQLTSYTVANYDGSMGVDLWDKKKWDEELEKHEVLVMVSQILKDMLDHKYISFRQVNLLVVDECHHTTLKHPMREMMKHYAMDKEIGMSPLPRIMGLTASIIITKSITPSIVNNKLKKLECALDSHLVTAIDYEEVKRYATNPKIILIKYSNVKSSSASPYMKSIIDQLEKLYIAIGEWTTIDDNVKKSFKRVIRNIMYVIQDLGEWCGARALKHELKAFDDMDINCDNPEVRKMASFLKNSLNNIYKICELQEMDFNNPELHVSHKVSRLLNIVQNSKRGENLSALIFVKMRCTAYLLTELMNELYATKPAYKYAKSCCVVGSNINKHGDLVETVQLLSKQSDTLKAFKNGEFRFLFSTSVLEEGVDVQKCNLVIRFDKPDNYRAYVQSKGRARKETAAYILFHDDQCMESNVKGYEALEKQLQQICHDRALPTIQEMIDSFSDDLLEPYMPFGVGGARITSSSCISLLNKYCGKLPHDKFTVVQPTFKIVKEPELDELLGDHDFDDDCSNASDKNGEGYVAEICLPLCAGYRLPMLGDPMPNKHWAKRSASLKLCQKLHEHGELTDSLLPIDRRLADDALINALIGDVGEEEENKSQGKVGTKTRRQIYKKKICNVFATEAGSTFHLYMFSITHNVKTIDAPEIEGEHCLGLLTAEKIYHCSFPLYNRKWGEVMVSVKPIKELILDSGTIWKIEQFHRNIFQLILDINSDVLQFNREDSTSKNLIVPLTLDGNIENCIVDSVAKLSNLNAPSAPAESGRIQFDFNASLYENAIVIPWYKSKTIFRVHKVTDLTPSSKFSQESYKSFNAYFEQNYNINIQNQHQNLLECGQVSSELKCLAPVAYRSRVSRERPHLVPELCYLLPISGQLYHHIHCLPSILQRLNGVNITADFIHFINILPLAPATNNCIDYRWCHKITQDILESAEVDNLCVALQENDTPRFNEYNFLLEAMCGEEPSVARIIPNKSQTDGRRTLSPLHVLQCFTPQSAGDCFNLERLEVLGDSFLKYHIGQMMFLQHPNWHEGRLSSNRCQFVSNKTLYILGRRLELPQFLQANSLPAVVGGPAPGFVVPPLVQAHLEAADRDAAIWHQYVMGDSENNEPDGASDDTSDDTSDNKRPSRTCYNPWTEQVVSDKMVADSFESLLGCVMLSGGMTAAHALMVKLGFTDMHKTVAVPQSALLRQETGTNEELRMDRQEVMMLYTKHCLDRLERVIGYTFKDKSFLLQAITHPSYTANKVTDFYQRLEFLGDAVLDFLVTGHVFKTANLSPGRITDIRCHFVRNETLARSCVIHGIHKYLLHFCPKLQYVLESFVYYVLNTDGNSSNEDSDDKYLDCSTVHKRVKLMKNLSSKRPKVSVTGDGLHSIGKNENELILSTDHNSSFTSAEEDTDGEEIIVVEGPNNVLNSEEDVCFSDDVEVPKILGDLVESILGAVYLDSGMSLRQVWNVTTTLLPELLQDTKSYSSISIDSVRQMYETGLLQKIESHPGIKAGEKATVEVQVSGLPKMVGIGKNLRTAKQAVAKMVLRRLQKKEDTEELATEELLKLRE